MRVVKKKSRRISRPVMCSQSTMDWHYKYSNRKAVGASKNVYVLYNLDQVISLCRKLHIASLQATGVRPHLAPDYIFMITHIKDNARKKSKKIEFLSASGLPLRR